MILAKKRCIYCSPESREKIGRRAKKAKMRFRPLSILCCRVVKHALLTPRNPAKSMGYRADRHRTCAPINTGRRGPGPGEVAPENRTGR